VETGQSRHPELMDYFALDGSWWLPGSPDHRVSGTLTFSADGLTLVVYGSLVPTVRVPNAVLEQTTPDWEETAVILGNSHAGKKVTLLGASGANFIGPHVSQSHYRVRLALTDVEVTVDAFAEVQCEFDCLTAWTEPPSISEPLDDSRRQFRLRFENAELGIAQVADAQVELIATVVGSIGETRLTQNKRRLSESGCHQRAAAISSISGCGPCKTCWYWYLDAPFDLPACT
jgi:ApeA N-terminal domain 1